MHELKALQDVQRKEEYLNLVRSFPGYAAVFFPPCPSDWHNNGYVIVSVSFNCLTLQACSSNGTPNGDAVEFAWSDIVSCAVSGEGVFSFEFGASSCKSTQIKVYSQFGHYLCSCFQRVNEERSAVGAIVNLLTNLEWKPRKRIAAFQDGRERIKDSSRNDRPANESAVS
uniref:Uncharacterized protein n=1 Tax=Trichuris muris TaxID=70415 RepID=A0A5S6Q7D4_TRIMR